MTTTALAVPAGRHARQVGLSGLSLLQVLALAGTLLLVLLGTLVGGRAYVASAAPATVVEPATVVSATAVADQREAATRLREV